MSVKYIPALMGQLSGIHLVWKDKKKFPKIFSQDPQCLQELEDSLFELESAKVKVTNMAWGTWILCVELA